MAPRDREECVYSQLESLKQLSLVEIWLLRDVLEWGKVLSDEEANFFINGGGLWLWRIPLSSSNGCV
jgi:hypothetical protein